MKNTIYQRSSERIKGGAPKGIKSAAKGGTNDIENLQTLYKDCNQGKKDKAWRGIRVQTAQILFDRKSKYVTLVTDRLQGEWHAF